MKMKSKGYMAGGKMKTKGYKSGGKLKMVKNAEGKEDLDSPNLSGLYIITDVRHHFDPTYSLTTINVARDTFGLTKNS